MPKDYFRAFERRAISLPVRVSTPGESPSPARLLNLCIGGACLESPGAPKPGALLRLELDAPHLWQPLTLPARVAWSQPTVEGSRIGITFQLDDGKLVGWLLDTLTSGRY